MLDLLGFWAREIIKSWTTEDKKWEISLWMAPFLIFYICLTLYSWTSKILSPLNISFTYLHQLFLYHSVVFVHSSVHWRNLQSMKKKPRLKQVQVKKQQYASKLEGNWDFNIQRLNISKFLWNYLKSEVLYQT